MSAWLFNMTSPPGVCGAERADDGQEPGDAVEGDGSLDQV